MIVEQIIEEIEKQEDIIFRAMKEKRELLEKLKNADAENYDWASVAEGARLIRVSPAMVYNLVNTGKVQRVKHIGSKIFVSKKELMDIDDKYMDR